jgi:hypothetical protein
MNCLMVLFCNTLTNLNQMCECLPGSREAGRRVRMCGYADVRMCEFADVRMCECADACPGSAKRGDGCECANVLVSLRHGRHSRKIKALNPAS